MKNKKLLLILLIATALLIFSGCKQKQVSNIETPKNMKVVQVTKGNIKIENDYAGEIKAMEQVEVLSKVPEKIASIFVDVGDKVSKGDILLKLDETDAKIQLDQARASVDAAKINLKSTQGSGYEQSLIQAKNAVEQAKLNYDNVKSNFEKLQALFAEGAAS